ncbi:hypothetical protein [Amycolatopsis samaneae]|uniref:DUF3592 domain-containing protein n=1 Tax=Amycolatopsis samaneae TaxID=664691 RepID=A0ABW5GEF9_9PSEU
MSGTYGSVAPTRLRPVALALRFLNGGVIGVSLSALVVGVLIESVPLVLAGLGLPPAYGLLRFVGGRPRRAREAAIVPLVALAKVESLRAGGTETGDLPVEFVLTVAPDGAPAYRVRVTHHVNLVDLPSYQKGDVLVVDYPPDRPWRARIVSHPAPEWRRRVAEAVIEPAPESTMVRKPPEGCASGVLTVLGLLLGAATVAVLFRAQLFAPETGTRPPEPPTSSSSTTVTSSGSATIDVGQGRSLLDAGELRHAIDSLATNTDVSQTLTAVVQERRLTVVFAPTGAQVPRFDLRALRVDDIPGLVRKALSTLQVGTPPTWQVTIVQLPTTLAVRVTVTGPQGSASLAADGG